MAARIVVHSLDQARAALAAAAALDCKVTLASAINAGTYGGPGWFKALTAMAAREFPTVAYDSVLDCGAAPGIALAALRLGLKRLRFTGNTAALQRLQEIAARMGATIEVNETKVLDLRGERDPEAVCRAWLAGEAVTQV